MPRPFVALSLLMLLVLAPVSAQDFAPVPANNDTASAQAKPDVDPTVPATTEDKYRLEFQVTTINETAIRRRIADLHRDYTALFTGPELVELLKQTKKATEARKTELASRADTLDEKMRAIKAQLEELKADASAVGVRRQLEAMMQAADQISEAPGKPQNDPLDQGRPLFDTTQPTPFGSPSVDSFRPSSPKREERKPAQLRDSF